MKVMELVSFSFSNGFLFEGKHSLAKTHIEAYNLSGFKKQRIEFGANTVAKKWEKKSRKEETQKERIPNFAYKFSPISGWPLNCSCMGQTLNSLLRINKLNRDVTCKVHRVRTLSSAKLIACKMNILRNRTDFRDYKTSCTVSRM